MKPVSSEALGQRMDAVLALAGAYFMNDSPIQHAARDIARRLDEAAIPYAVAGALSLAAHGFVRLTEHIDLMVTREGLEKFKSAWLGRGYVNVDPGGKPVRDTVHHVRIDFLLAGDFPGDRKPKPVAIPEPSRVSVPAGSYRVVSLPILVSLKLASGMTAPHRLQDLADIIGLIRAAQIPRDFADQLDSYVREKFDEMWALAQHADDDY